MNFRRLLLPFSLIYSLITTLRNFFYDYGLFKSHFISGPSILIGNITVGGTGKSPLVHWILELIKEEKPVLLSRGYGRQTKGLIEANPDTTVEEIGDEPFMLKKKASFDLAVFVAEKRILGVQAIRSKHKHSPIILDDAFQHRAVKAGLNFVLMRFDQPTFNDFTFPAGDLRETRNGIYRADYIIVTKCPENLSTTVKANFIKKMKVESNKVFFSTLKYGPLIQQTTNSKTTEYEATILVSGIAQPSYFNNHFKNEKQCVVLNYPDHHLFTEKELQTIHQKVANFTPKQCRIITTEKDWVKWEKLKDSPLFNTLDWYVQPIVVEIDKEEELKEIIKNYVATKR